MGLKEDGLEEEVRVDTSTSEEGVIDEFSDTIQQEVLGECTFFEGVGNVIMLDFEIDL